MEGDISPLPLFPPVDSNFKLRKTKNAETLTELCMRETIRIRRRH